MLWEDSSFRKLVRTQSHLLCCMSMSSQPAVAKSRNDNAILAFGRLLLFATLGCRIAIP